MQFLIWNLNEKAEIENRQTRLNIENEEMMPGKRGRGCFSVRIGGFILSPLKSHDGHDFAFSSQGTLTTSSTRNRYLEKNKKKKKRRGEGISL